MGFKEDGARFVEGITFRDPKIGFAAGEVTRFVEIGRDDDEDDGRDFHYEHERHGMLPQSLEFLQQDKQTGTGRRGSKAGMQEAGSRVIGYAQSYGQAYGQRYAQG